MNRQLLIGAFLLYLLPSSFCGELVKVHMMDDGKALSIEFVFVDGKGTSIIPKFFQDYESKEGMYSINFLQTRSGIPYGVYQIKNHNPFTTEMIIEQVQRKKGTKTRSFLSVQFPSNPGKANPKYPTSVSPSKQLVLSLGKSAGYTFHWTVSPATQPTSLLEPSSAQQQQAESQHDSLPGRTPLPKVPQKPKPPDTVHVQTVLGTEMAIEMGMAIDKQREAEKTPPGKAFMVSKKEELFLALHFETKLREGPSTSTPIVQVLEVGTEVKKVGKKKNWLQVAIDGDTGFIRRDLLAYKDRITPQQRQSIEKKRKVKQAKEREQSQAREAAKKRAELEKQKAAERERQTKAEEEARLKAAELERQRKKQEAMRKKAELEREKREEALKQKELEKKYAAEKQRLAELERIKKEKEKALKLAEKKRKEEEARLKRKKARERVRYSSFGRRDPFVPVEQVAMGDRDINLEHMKLAGIIWNPSDPLAVLEHRTEPSISIAIRKGDKIAHGKATHITPKSVVFEILEYGVYRTYTLRMEAQGERKKR